MVRGNGKVVGGEARCRMDWGSVCEAAGWPGLGSTCTLPMLYRTIRINSF